MHDDSFAYRRGRSIRAAAERHVGAAWLVKLDLHDFFPSVSENRVYRTFQELGYANLVSFELGRLTTRPKWRRCKWQAVRRVISASSQNC